MVRYYGDSTGKWQPGISTNQKQNIFQNLNGLTTVQMDYAHVNSLDNSNKLCKVLARCALLQVMNRKGIDGQPCKKKKDQPAVPNYKYLKTTLRWED